MLATSVTLLNSRIARGQIAFDVPTDCGSRELFEANIRARVGEREAKAILDVLALRIRGQVGTYTLTMQVGSETRSLQDQDCNQLFRAAMVVAIALWETPIQPESSNPQRRSHATDEPAVLGPISSKQLPQSTPLVARLSGPVGYVSTQVASRRRNQLQLAAELGVATGVQPRPGVFLGARAALDADRFGIHASLRWAPARGDRDTNNRGVEVSALGLLAAGYYKPLSFVGVELGARVDHLEGTGLGSAENSTAEVWSFGPLIGVWAILLRSGGALVSIGAEGHLPLLRPSFEISGYGGVFRVAPIGVGTFLAAGYSF